MDGFKIFNWCAGLYLLGAVVCFGPATVQSERSRDEHRAECARTPALPCAYGPMPSDGLFKAMFWPLWLSYTVAKGVSE